MKYLITLLLLPSLLLGTDEKFSIKVTTTDVVEKPINTIVDKLFKYGVTYKDTITGKQAVKTGTHPVAWDSAGVMVPHRLTGQATTSALAAKSDPEVKVEYDEEYNVGPFKIEYLKSYPGKMRYTKRGTSLEFFPAFDTTNTKTIFTISSIGIKEEVILTSKSPTRLAWKYNLSGHDTTKTLAEGMPLYGADGTVNGYIPKLVAWDNSDRVIELVVNFTADSLIVLVDTAGAIFPITVDPSINDTTLGNFIGQSGWDEVAAYLTVRNSTDGENASTNLIYAVNSLYSGTRIQVRRGFLRLDVSGVSLGVGSVLDSAKIFLNTQYTNNVNDSAYVVRGTTSGDSVLTTWFNDFVGWASSGTYSGIKTITTLTGNVAGNYTIGKFTEYGEAYLDSVIGSGSMNLAVLNKWDVNATEPVTDNHHSRWEAVTPPPYMTIFYTENHQPGITTADSLNVDMVTVILYANADSVGTANMTERGFEYMVLGNLTDTTSISESGDFGAGAFQDTTGGVPNDSSIVARAWGENDAGKSYGAWKTILTSVGVSIPLNVMGIEGTSVVNY